MSGKRWKQTCSIVLRKQTILGRPQTPPDATGHLELFLRKTYFQCFSAWTVNHGCLKNVKSTVYCIAHFILLHILLFIFTYFYFFYLYLYIFSCVVLNVLHCPLSGPNLIYISLLIIFCIIEYVTNKKTLNLENVNHGCNHGCKMFEVILNGN